MPQLQAKNRTHRIWYAVTYIRLFVRRPKRGRPTTHKCIAHENTILVEAQDECEAYDRCVTQIGPACLGEYNEASDAMIVYDGSFGGVISVASIGSKIQDYCEVHWEKYSTTVEKVKAIVPAREQVIPSAKAAKKENSQDRKRRALKRG